MMQIPMPLDIPSPRAASAAVPTSASLAGGELEFAHVMHTDDLIDYSSSSHIRQRGVRRMNKVTPVARYFPLVPPPSYTPPGNNIKSIQQQLALRLAFLRDPHPDREALIDMGIRFGLPSHEITTWFKSERHRFKKKGGIVLAGNASASAWHLAMQDLPLAPTSHGPQSTTKTVDMEKRAIRAADTRRALTPYQLKRSRAWAVRVCLSVYPHCSSLIFHVQEEYALLPDANERAYRVAQLVDRQDARLKREFRAAVVNEPSLGLRCDQEFKARKSCADPSCGRDVVAERADSCWDFMRARFGATMFSTTEKYVDNGTYTGNILLDAGLLSGLEMMFMRHRDYFMALAHRLNIQGMSYELQSNRNN
ncbi:hypothetical protein DYB37_008734 [Aphanomyces astaci]|uniref:Homeobox domain-containing protein n=1 Tax=Aphanomyces astaci TaxID=112090 RepID=A0A3R6WM13_APHAT|nr:hypothetical protein DYB35_002127 [Aphanomyces astaci]RHZ03504.1 hypothetical protein DYB37_008734 [Aphanomyces astaci]